MTDNAFGEIDKGRKGEIWRKKIKWIWENARDIEDKQRFITQ